MIRTIRTAQELFSVLDSARRMRDRPEYKRILAELEARCQKILEEHDGRLKNGNTLFELDGEVIGISQVKDLNFVAFDVVEIGGLQPEIAR